MSRKDNSPRFLIAWTTVTYRAVALTILGMVMIAATVLYFLRPDLAQTAVQTVTKFADRVAGNPEKAKLAAGPQQASFTLIDGTVRVKKANSNTWVNADYTLPLERGDVVQTTSEGMAKVVFPDGTNYAIKQDSLIVIEENSANDAQQTRVSVQITSGTVDLTTGTYQQGSRSQVVVAGATATFARDSSAMVHNDPRSDEHEILLKRGSGDVKRGTETVRLGDYEKVSFKADSKLVKEKEIAPPTLISPANMMPIFVGDAPQDIDFSWSPVIGSSGYHVKVSRNPYFSSTVVDKAVDTSFMRVSGLGEGAYYWFVRSRGSTGRESVESEKNRFTIIRKGPESIAMVLELQPFVQHGHVMEIKGKTEANARVMVNGQEVPVIGSDGSFQFFTSPLPNGENLITITAQNTKGGVKTLQRKVVIQ